MSLMERLERRQMLSDPGQLDTTFSGDGRAPFPFGPGELVGVQPSGKIVVTRDDTGGFRLDRLNADGTADASFLGGATLTTQSGNIFFDINPVDGRIAMVSGTGGGDTRVAVFKADGSPDDSFDTDGLRDLDINYVAHRIAWQGDKLILLGGSFPNDDDGFDPLQVRRLNANGSTDGTFGTGGVLTFPVNNVDKAELEIGSGGSIVIAIGSNLNNAQRVAVYRYTAAGQPDGTFGGGAGFVNIATDTDDSNLNLLAFTVVEDGSVVTLHSNSDGVNYRRLTPEGFVSGQSAALNFAAWGTVLGQTSFPDQIAFQPDGKVLLIGPALPGANPSGWAIVRMNPLGGVDTTYGSNGIALPQAEHNGRAVVQTDGKVLVSGDRFGVDGVEVMRIDSGTLSLGTIRVNKKGSLIMNGTDASENISVSIRGRDGKLIARVGTFAIGLAPSRVKRIAIFAGAGDDTITIGNGVRGSYAQGDDGFDTLNGGQNDDVFLGGLNADKLFGNDGNDILVGEGGADYCLGGAGKDDLFGNGGVDTLSGAGGNDRLFGGGEADRVLGGAGIDTAAQSTEDEFDSIEGFLTPPAEA